MSRNIILVTLDSLRADHCGYVGYERETTPTIDRLATNGIAFTNAVASSIPTVTSMASVHTGEYPLASPQIGFTGEQRREVTTRPKIAEVLSDAGYSTGALTPNPPSSSFFGFDEGFDWFEDFLADDEGLFERVENRIFQHSIQGSDLSTYLRLVRNLVWRKEILQPWGDFYEDLIEWRAGVEEPYFLWVLLLDTHHPWLPPTEEQRWSSRADKLRAFHHYWQMMNSGWEPDFDDDIRQRLIDLYDDSIRYADRFVKRLAEDLSDDDPAFLVHADHGEEFGDHGRYGHQPFLYEELIHVPLVVGNVQDDRTIETPVGLREIAPTVADIADVDHPFTSRSLLSKSDSHWKVAKVFADDRRRLAVRMQNKKYLQGQHDSEELYNLASDSREQSNEAETNTQLTAALDSVADTHIREEKERRAVRTGVEELVEAEQI